MDQEKLIASIQGELAHLWMIRTCLKHADEIQENEEMLDVPRTLFDCIRATEPAFQKKDWPEFFHRLGGKMSKLRRASDYYSSNYKNFSDHTNFEMAAASLGAAVARLKELLEAKEQLPPECP